MKTSRGFKVGLALGGGGARGLAHIGVLKVLSSQALPIDLVVGTSMGAIVGAVFCLNPDTDALERRILDAVNRPEIKNMESFFYPATEENQQKFLIQKLLSKIKNIYFWNLRVAKKWLIRSGPIIKVLERLFDNQDFLDMKIPFACVSLDLNSACNVIIKEGRVLEAILASCSIPGVFAPRKCGEQLLTDGGILAALPARQARILGADFVIGVDLSLSYCRRELNTGLDVMFQADWVKSHYLNQLNLKYCDWVITPQMPDVNWSAFSRGEFCIQQGESAALRDIEKIRRSLLKKKRFYFLTKLFPARKKYLD
jgi:NTE family protein